MRAFLIFTPWFLLLGSCSAPPKPPTVDESLRRPANTLQAVELQACKTNLNGAKLELQAGNRRAEAAAHLHEQVLERQRALTSRTTQPVRAPEPNSVFTVRFDFGSTRLVMPDAQAAALVTEAKSAPLIVVRGRTDGSQDSIAESLIARERAAAVRDLLIGAGVDPSRVRTTYQPVGDHIAENTTASGRLLNRRAEVEVYRILPSHRTSPVPSPEQ